MPKVFDFSVRQINIVALRKILVADFHISELTDLSFDLGIDHETLPGRTKQVQARELIVQCRHENRLQELVTLVLERRPLIERHILILDGEAQAPFKGLESFTETDADLFYGRDKEIGKLATHLIDHSFLAVVGASGSGKSSLVQAGLVPSLQSGVLSDSLPDSTNWLIHLITPTASPLKKLATTLTRDSESVKSTTLLLDALKSDNRSLDLYISRLLHNRKGRLLLIVDQFEELFTRVVP